MPDSDTARLIEELRQASLVLEDPSFDATDAELHARAAGCSGGCGRTRRQS